MDAEMYRDARILVVDDQQTNIDLVTGILSRAGLGKVTTTTDSTASVALFVETQPDLVLLDMLMPRMDGHQLLAALKPLVPADDFVPMVVLTADATTETRRRALENGADDFLTKPLDAYEVVSRIRNLLRSRFLHRDLRLKNVGLEGEVRRRTALAVASEARYRRLVSASPDGIALLDEAGGVLFCNREAARLLGHGGEAEAVGADLLDRVAPARRDELAKALGEALLSDAVRRCEHILRVDGGVGVPVEISLAAMPAEPDEPPGLVATLHDVTDRHLRETERERQLERLSAVHQIDMAITGSVALAPVLHVVTDEVAQQLDVDAVAVWLLEESEQCLELAAQRGMSAAVHQTERYRVGQNVIGQAALDGRAVALLDLRVPAAAQSLPPSLASEGFVTCHAAPLLAKGRINGVLAVFKRSPFVPDAGWLAFFEALGTQVAIAVDLSGMVERLRRANADLTQAYETTLDGWSKAVDLRDKETEGHTLRVTEATIRFARILGMSGEQIVQVRRGALLHDIGKLGVPDAVLLKPGKLTDEEWVIMRRHPVLAFELLSPIEFLRPAIDIPYCHHEKWDGSGYPRGLIGQQIPLTARAFALIDVWDALRSDRPYRAAWSVERVAAYIAERRGTEFDPDLTDIFLRDAEAITAPVVA